MPDESHLLAVEKSVTAHKGGLERHCCVAERKEWKGAKEEEGNLLRNFYRFVADLPAAHYQCTTTTTYAPGKSYFPALSGDLHFSRRSFVDSEYKRARFPRDHHAYIRLFIHRSRLIKSVKRRSQTSSISFLRLRLDGGDRSTNKLFLHYQFLDEIKSNLLLRSSIRNYLITRISKRAKDTRKYTYFLVYIRFVRIPRVTFE